MWEKNTAVKKDATTCTSTPDSTSLSKEKEGNEPGANAGFFI
jgi:hypothetical protein